MPEISVWPVSSLVCTRKVGSSSARRPSATDIFSWSDFVFGSIGDLDDGLGEVDLLELDRRCPGAHSVSPVTICLMPTAAAMSPA